ncbi:MAG: phosphatase [Bacteroidia bacterium]|nr:phosphatase [Bacteroidia bacterium]
MPEKRIAVIDCGTNTFNLLIAEKTESGYRFLYRGKRVVKLGSQGIKDGIIGPDPADRALKALRSYKMLLDRFRVQRTEVVGTAALRDAKNGAVLLRQIKRETGFRIRLIDGKEEASYIYQGVKAAVHLQEHISLIMDIGGGSTEFILCNRNKIFWKRSYRLGAARLLEILQPGDPIKKTEIRRLNALLKEELVSLENAWERYPPAELIGSSGSFDTFAAILLKKKQRSLGKKTQYTFDMHAFQQLHRQLMSATYRERLAIPGMLRMRADMIGLASLLLTFVLRQSKIKTMRLSTYALKEGLLAEMAP